LTLLTRSRHRRRFDVPYEAMSTSLRDQLLKAGLISKKQANDVERQIERQERPRSGKNRPPAGAVSPQVARGAPVAKAAQAKVAHDRELNRRQREKAENKARLAQAKQLVEQNRITAAASGEYFNFVDGPKIRRIAVDDAIRERLMRGDIAIVSFNGSYELVPRAVAERIAERDARLIAVTRTRAETCPPIPSMRVSTYPMI